MRILVVSLANLANSGGEAVTSLRLARAFAELGHAVTLLAPDANERNTAIDCAPARVAMSFNLGRLGLPNSFNTLTQLWPAVRGAWCHDIDLVYVRAGMLTFLFGVCLRWCSGVVVASEHHGWLAAERLMSGRHTWFAPLERRLQIADARFARVVRTVVPGIKALLVDGGIEPARINVIGNASDTERIRPRERNAALAAYKLSADRVYLGFVGSLVKWQGLDTVLRGFALLRARRPDTHLLIVGDGPQRAELAAQVSDLGLTGAVTFSGNLAHDEIDAMLACFDLSLLPTHTGAYTRIGRSPLKLREYAAAGRAVLAAHIVEVDTLESEPWIAYYTPGDAGDFALQAANILAEPLQLAARGRAARAYAERHFAWPVIARQILDTLPPARGTAGRFAC